MCCEIRLGGTARSPEDVIALHKLGLEFAEIPIKDETNFLAFKDDYQALGRQLGLFYLCHGPQEGNPHDVKALKNEYLPKLMQILSFMPELDMKLLTLHLWLDPRFVSQEVIAFKIDLLKKITERAMGAGITICVENLSENATQMARPFEALPYLNLTLDVGHAQLLTSENTSIEFIAKYPQRIKHVHLHDNRGGNSPEGDLHLPIGEGIVDFRGILDQLKTIGYHRTMTLELKPSEISRCLANVNQLLATC